MKRSEKISFIKTSPSYYSKADFNYCSDEQLDKIIELIVIQLQIDCNEIEVKKIGYIYLN